LALALIGTLYVLPRSALEELIVRPETNILVRAGSAGFLLVVILGFFLKMFFECASAPSVHRRGGWLLVMIVIPIFSAFIYFFVTRSKRYQDYVRRGLASRTN
jgi:hypothetical protein